MVSWGDCPIFHIEKSYQPTVNGSPHQKGGLNGAGSISHFKKETKDPDHFDSLIKDSIQTNLKNRIIG